MYRVLNFASISFFLNVQHAWHAHRVALLQKEEVVGNSNHTFPRLSAGSIEVALASSSSSSEKGYLQYLGFSACLFFFRRTDSHASTRGLSETAFFLVFCSFVFSSRCHTLIVMAGGPVHATDRC